MTNLKFMIGGYPWPEMDTETIVQIDDITVTVPEPATLGLLATGALALLRRRNR